MKGKRSASMLEVVTSYIATHELLSTTDRIVVAVSGGADSLCLLHILHQLCGPDKLYPNLQLHVAHLNHQLRGEESERDASVVSQLARSWGLPVSIGSIDVAALAREEHRSLEEAARESRYRFLREVAQGQPIAVAHHIDDQIETLILHWLRGGGISSMIGLLPRQNDIIRPLLCVTRVDTQRYCQHFGLIPLEDKSNLDLRFQRNRIRHELIPLLEKLNPGLQTTLLRTAEVIKIDVEWIEAQIDAHWSAVVLMEEDQRMMRVQRSALCALPLSLQRHLLRRLTAQLCGGQSPLELRHYQLLEELFSRESGQRELALHLPEGIHVLRQGEEIVFERGVSVALQDIVSEAEQVLLPIPGRIAIAGTIWTAVAEIVVGGPLEVVLEALSRQDWELVWQTLRPTQHTVYIDGDIPGDIVLVRLRQPGDRIRPLGMLVEKKVQDVLVDKHIPRSLRESIPLFFSEQHCLWLAGVTIDDRVRLSSETRRIVRLKIVPTEGSLEHKKGIGAAE